MKINQYVDLTMKIITALHLILLLTLTSLAHSQSTNFIGLSDFHLNPFDLSSNYPAGSEDTNPFYLKRFIGSVAYITTHDKNGNILPKDQLPQFILITGDLLAHSFSDKVAQNKDTSICSSDVPSCALATMDTLINTIKETQNGIFEHTPIYLTLGNNDFDTGDYSVNQNFLEKLAGDFYDYAHPDDGIEDDKNTFITNFTKNEGAYSLEGPGDDQNLSLLSLNTVIYANKTNDAGALALTCIVNSKPVDCKSFRETQNEFITGYMTDHTAFNGKIIAIMHIPPYQVTADKLNYGYDNQAKPGLNNAFAPKAYTIAGHWHMYSPLNNTVNGVMQSSVTFRKGVKPGFILYSFANGKIAQMKQCAIEDPSKLSKPDVALNFSCQ
jgi:Icc-related predicted phosphoesterase